MTASHPPYNRAVAFLTHPMLLVLVVGLVFGNTAVWTLSYDPEYLPYSVAWSVTALTGGLAAFATVRWLDERVAVGTGVLITITAIARSVANLWQSFFGPDDIVDIATLRVGAGVWFLLAVLIYAMWTRLVLPWIVVYRRGSR